MPVLELKSLKSNPLRDFTVDPIDDAKVAELRESIKEDGFWGGVICRRLPDGTVQIGAGHHRIKAALAAGLRTAELFVHDALDDAGMVRVYARENATQRGNTSAAMAGTVASALRFLAKSLMMGHVPEISGTSAKSIEILRGQLGSEKGLGQDIIQRFLDGVPGMNIGVVIQQLANLKASGDYARIIGEVQAEIEAEHKDALRKLAEAERQRAEAEERERKAEEKRKAAVIAAKAAREDADRKRAIEAQKRAEIEAELAEKQRQKLDVELKEFDALRRTRDIANDAVEASSQRERTFDLESVAQWLTNSHQLDVFRSIVTGAGIRPYLPLSKQGAVARAVVQAAKKDGRELTGAFIREFITTTVLGAKYTERKLTREDQEKMLRDSFLMRARQYQGAFTGACNQMIHVGQKLAELQKEWPKGLAFPITPEFRQTVKNVRTIVDQLERRL